VKKPVKVLIFSLGILLLMISATVASIYIASNARIGRSFIVTAGHIPVFKSPADLAEGERLYVRGAAATAMALMRVAKPLSTTRQSVESLVQI
jgi:hypothetical protein